MHESDDTILEVTQGHVNPSEPGTMSGVAIQSHVGVRKNSNRLRVRKQSKRH